MSTAPAEDPTQDPDWHLVHAAARTTVPTPPGLVDRVLRSVRGLRGGSGELEYHQDGGRLRVSEQVVVLLARRLAAELGHRIGGLHVAAVAFQAGELEVLTTVRYGVHADEAAEALRSRLARALTAELGEPAPTVNVHVVDVHLD
ncbi:Asp23/Gls24 family envelope stress response protein [Saccharothrix sp. AJ9571]|nr:Asp23/Gls24 family envelope stress response protein [Saccharothrix sp. AJ9571]